MNTVIEFIDSGANKTIVSFTGTRHRFAPGDFKKEFIGLIKQSDYNVMFVADREVSWYNTIDVDKIKSKLINQEVITIGNSMGAYNAIQFANDINVTKVIAFSTQYSIHRDIVPDEERWKRHAKKIKQWKHEHLIFNDITEYYIFSGDDKMEMYHTDMIPHQRNVHKFIARGGHHLSAILKNKGILYSLIEDCINNPAKIVAEKYAKDIELFGYKYGE